MEFKTPYQRLFRNEHEDIKREIVRCEFLEKVNDEYRIPPHIGYQIKSCMITNCDARDIQTLSLRTQYGNFVWSIGGETLHLLQYEIGIFYPDLIRQNCVVFPVNPLMYTNTFYDPLFIQIVMKDGKTFTDVRVIYTYNNMPMNSPCNFNFPQIEHMYEQLVVSNYETSFNSANTIFLYFTNSKNEKVNIDESTVTYEMEKFVIFQQQKLQNFTHGMNDGCNDVENVYSFNLDTIVYTANMENNFSIPTKCKTTIKFNSLPPNLTAHIITIRNNVVLKISGGTVFKYV